MCTNQRSIVQTSARMTEAACRGHSEVDMSGYNNDRLASMLETGIKEVGCRRSSCRRIEGISGSA